MIHLLATGGTIAMQQDPAAGGNVPALGGQALLDLVGSLSPEHQVRVEDWERLPGVHRGPVELWAMRERVAAIVSGPDAPAGVVITHGTDTMSETAKMLLERVKNKTIVLTGAMVPYKFGSSDGLFNLGSAMAFVQTLPNGVYVAMNGRYFTANNVRKNKETGEFEEIERV